MTIATCSIVGSGMAAHAIGRRLRSFGIEIISVTGRNRAKVAELAEVLGAKPGAIADTTVDADLLLLAVADSSVRDVGNMLGASLLNSNCGVAHMAGALRLDVLPTSDRRIKMHPIAALAGGPSRLEGVVWGIEADDSMRSQAFALVERLGGLPIDTTHVDLALYHLAAVFASNFALGLLAVAARLWTDSGAPLPALEALIPLTRTVLDNWGELGLDRAATGPIARGDVTAVAQQMRTVAPMGESMGALYRALALTTADLAGQSAGINADAIAEIARLLTESRVLN